MPRKKTVENAGTYAARKRNTEAAVRMVRGAMETGKFSGRVTSASGTPGPAGVLTTGHYSSSGQRMYGGYSASSGKQHYNIKKGRSKSPSKVDKYTPSRNEIADYRKMPRLPGAR